MIPAIEFSNVQRRESVPNAKILAIPASWYTMMDNAITPEDDKHA
jgi:hypothetical protein